MNGEICLLISFWGTLPVGSSIELVISLVFWFSFKYMFWNLSTIKQHVNYNLKYCLHAFAFVAGYGYYLTNLGRLRPCAISCNSTTKAKLGAVVLLSSFHVSTKEQQQYS